MTSNDFLEWMGAVVTIFLGTFLALVGALVGLGLIFILILNAVT